jgi:hypothetical protein
VVTVPLVGWVPLHPPDAAHVCASFALHCKVAGVPMTMLLLVAASATAGFAAPLAAGSGRADWPADDCPQAANAENAAHPTIPRSKREAAAERNASRMLVVILVSRPDFEENSDPKLGVRPTNFIRCFPSSQSRNRIISGIFTSANVSQFANVSPIGGIGIAYVKATQ